MKMKMKMTLKATSSVVPWMSRCAILLSLVFGIVVVVSGCYSQAPVDVTALRHRASLDMKCEAVSAQPIIDQRTHLVRGCGQEAVYVRNCQTWSHNYGTAEINCTWLLNRGPSPIAAR
jgi:hypothetical protein